MDIAPFLNKINNAILNPIILLLFVVAFLVFFWGLVQFIRSPAADKGQGKRNIIFGLLGMFIMFSAYGLIHLVLGTFGIKESTYPFTTTSSSLKK